MAQRSAIEANETETSIADESAPGVLTSPTWVQRDPNAFPGGFGATYKRVSRRPINPSRQKRKSVNVGREAGAGIEEDFLQESSQRVFSRFFYADFAEKPSAIINSVTADAFVVDDDEDFFVDAIVQSKKCGVSANNGLFVVTAVAANEIDATGLAVDAVAAVDATLVTVGHRVPSGDIEVVTTGNLARLVSPGSAVDFRLWKLRPGEPFFLGGDGGRAFDNSANNGIKRAKEIAADGSYIIIDKSEFPMVAEVSNNVVDVFLGRNLRNEQGVNILRRTVQIERKLGYPDDAQPSQIQSEYLVQAWPDELEFAADEEDLLKYTQNYLAAKYEVRTGATGPKAGTRVAVDTSADGYNTSKDVLFIRLAEYDAINEGKTPLFAHVTNFNFTIKNNVKLLKAIGTYGAFAAILGLFEVEIDTEAYFETVEAIDLIENNLDTTLMALLSKENSNNGVCFDWPLLGLDTDGINVEQDDALMLPLKMDAATAAKHGIDHTMNVTYFDWLPSLAYTLAGV